MKVIYCTATLYIACIGASDSKWFSAERVRKLIGAYSCKEKPFQTRDSWSRLAVPSVLNMARQPSAALCLGVLPLLLLSCWGTARGEGKEINE